MSERTLLAGLWLRMAVAAILGLAGIVVLVGTELAVVVVMTFFLAYLLPFFVVAFIVFGLCIGLFAVVWWLTVAALGVVVSPGVLSERIDSKGVDDLVADAGTVFWNPKLAELRSATVRVIGLALGIGLVYLLCGLVYRLSGVTVVLFSIVGSTVLVASHVSYIAYTELTGSASAVRQDIEANYTIVEDTDREQRVEGRLRRLAQQLSVPTPAVEIGASATPQAATVGYRPEQSVLVVSRGLLDRLDDEQLDAVLAHELAHLKNRDGAILTALSLPMTKVSDLVDRTLKPGGDAVLIVLFVGAPVYVVSRLSVAVVARYREYVADYGAAKLTGDPIALASALETLDDAQTSRPDKDLRAYDSSTAFGIVPPPWRERKVLDRTTRFFYRRILGTHPPTESRIERLKGYDTT